MNEIELSVIIPCYNSEKTIFYTLENIIRELSGIFNYEILIINDGSTDNSETIINNYIRTNNNIRIISQTNKGVSHARNVGLLNAKGTYFWFIDSDDLLFENIGSPLKSIIEEYKPDILSFESVTIDYKVKNTNIFNNSNNYKIRYIGCFKNYLSKRICGDFVWPYIIKRKLIINNNIFFNTDLYGGEDSYWNILLAKFCSKSNIVVTNLKVIKYMVYPKSITNTSTPPHNLKILKSYLNIINKLNKLENENLPYLIPTINAFRQTAIQKSITRFLSCSLSFKEISRYSEIIKYHINKNDLDYTIIIKFFIFISNHPLHIKVSQFFYRNIFLKFIKPYLGRN